jgi:hypothetical protein
LSFNSKLSHFDKNLNLNYKWLSSTWEKPIWFCFMGSKDTFQCTTLCKRDYGRFEIDKRDLGKIENQPQIGTRRLGNHLGVSQFVVWLRVQNAALEICENRGILN